MLTKIKADEARGRIVRGVIVGGYREKALFTFSDGTYFAVEIERGYDGDGYLRESDSSPFELGLSTHECVAAGLYTAEEYEAAKQERDAKFKEQNRQRELAQLAELKRRYED